MHVELRLRERDRPALGYLQLETDEVDAGHGLGDTVLDLQAGVHLEEPGLVPGDEEFDGPEAEVADRAREADRTGTEPVTKRSPQAGGGSFLDDFLVAPLRRAVALEKVDDPTRLVGRHLHFDMAPVLDETLDQQRRVPEGRLRLAPGRSQAVAELRLVGDDAHGFSSPAGDGFDKCREADPGQHRGDELLVVGAATPCRREHGEAGVFCEPPGVVLPAHGLDDRRRWADEDEARLCARPGEACAL